MEQELCEVGAAVRLRSATPIVPVRRVSRSIGFYTDVLGFRLADRNAEGTFAFLTRGDASVMLLDLGDPKSVMATAHYLSAYYWVENVAGYYAAIRPQLDRLPASRVNPLFTKPDGRQEFHVRDPDGFLIFFGEALPG